MFKAKKKINFEHPEVPNSENMEQGPYLRLVKDKPWLHTKASDFLYGRQGPWPQPSPAHPLGESPAVCHLPLIETVDWWAFIGSRYMATLAYTPFAYMGGILKPGLEEVTDSEFHHMLTGTMLSKFITAKLDKYDLKNFEKDMKSDQTYFIVDLMSVDVVKPFEGQYVSGTKTLLRETAPEEFEVEAIYVHGSKEVFHKTDGNAWELAKYYVLQGGALAATLVIHPLLHFPYDSINAITKTALPKDHVLFKLIHPHLRFTLPLENAVLQYKSSLLSAKWWMSYAPYPGTAEGLRDLLVEGYMGVEGNDSYPPFQYPMQPEKVYGPYGKFLDRYYQVFYNYVSKVLEGISSDDYYVGQWAHHVAKHVPGFPNEKEIFEGDNLARAVSIYLWDITVAHTVDHYNYGNMNIRKIPLRLRQAPPKKGEEKLNRKKLTKFWDYGKYRMCQILFFQSTTVTSLPNTKYKFDSPKLQEYATKFISDLKACDKQLKEEGIQFIPLNKIARTIQS